MTLLVTVALQNLARLDTSPGASGPHAFVVRACIARLAAQASSIAFHPAFVAIAIRPSLGWNRRIKATDLGAASSHFYENRISFFEKRNGANNARWLLAEAAADVQRLKRA
jgi:hypothetical protein